MRPEADFRSPKPMMKKNRRGGGNEETAGGARRRTDEAGRDQFIPGDPPAPPRLLTADLEEEDEEVQGFKIKFILQRGRTGSVSK